MIYGCEMLDDDEVEFSNLPVRIRKLIIHLWETNPEICPPIGSTSDPNDQIGQPSLVDKIVFEDFEDQEDNEEQNLLISSLPTQNVPEDPASPETLEQAKKHKGKGVAYEGYETSSDHQLTVFERNHTPTEIDAATDSDNDSDNRTLSDLYTELRIKRRRQHKENVDKAAENRNNPKRKPKFSKKQSFRYLSEINTELRDEHLEIPLPNASVDGITQILASVPNMEETNLENNKNKKHKALKTKESPRLDEAGPSNHGAVNRSGCTEPCGSRPVFDLVSIAKPLSQVHRKRSSRPFRSSLTWGRDKKARPLEHLPETLNSDNDINDPRVEEAVGILLSLGEKICRGLGDCNVCEPSGSQSEEVVRAAEVNGSADEVEMVQAMEPEHENFECMLNQNPAEFDSEDAQKFMRS